MIRNYTHAYKFNYHSVRLTQVFIGICLVLLTFGFAPKVWADNVTQKITITGTVLDSISGERLGYITLQETGTTNGTMTDDLGTFRLEVKSGAQLRVQCVGYRTKTVNAGKYSHNITVRITPSDYEIKEVVVKPKREHYRRKDNPSVTLARAVIEHKNDHELTSHDYYTCERYDKMTYSFNNFDEGVQKIWKKKFDFIENYIDTAVLSGSPILPISTDERIETHYYRRDPEVKKTVVEGVQHAGLDDMFPNELVQLMKTEVFPEVNLNENDIYLFTNKFVSPLSSFAPAFYKFYILDTVQWADGNRYVDLGFAPLIPESFGFIGHLYVALDSTYFVRQAVLNVPPDINLNFVRTMRIVLDYDRLPDSTRVCRTSTFDSEMNITENTMGLYAHRTCAYNNFSFEAPATEVQTSVYNAYEPVIEAPDVTHRSADYWAEHRVGKGVPQERSVASMLNEMRTVPLFYYGEKLLTMLFKGYVPIGKKPYEENKFLVGPLNTTVSHNSFEGWRFRTGGITTAALNKHWFGFGYVAYGLDDAKLKGEARVEYSFNAKKMHANEFPIHSLRARYNYDTKLLGEEFSTSKDNFLLSIKRDNDEKITYERNFEVTYTREYWSGLSYRLTLAQQREYATRLTHFQRVGDSRYVGHYDMTTASFNIRYAHNERFLQSRTSRIPVNKQTPVFSLTHTIGIKDFAGTDFDYQRTEFKFSKRFWMSAFGYVDANLKAGKVWTSSPYTMLCLPSANLAYTIQDESFAQMNALEFINDEYASWDLVYFLNGCVFNTIPLFRRLKWREVVSYRGLLGSLSDRNDPRALNDDGSLRNPDLYNFPGENTIYRMGHIPYMEFAVGIENIFKCLRVDYIRRLTYLDHPGINRNGVQITMHLTF
jgi:hypothetical protein